MHRPPFVVWLAPTEPAFPSNFFPYLGEKTPRRMAAVGNPAILHTKPLVLICSVKCPGNLVLQTYDVAKDLRAAARPVIGGFHSRMERECLRILLRGSQPIIICPARSLNGMRLSNEYKNSLGQGRLLLLSPFSDKCRRATVQIALYRNHFVATLAECIFVPMRPHSVKKISYAQIISPEGKAFIHWRAMKPFT